MCCKRGVPFYVLNNRPENYYIFTGGVTHKKSHIGTEKVFVSSVENLEPNKCWNKIATYLVTESSCGNSVLQANYDQDWNHIM